MRRGPLIALMISLIAALVPGAQAADTPYPETPDHLRAFSIVPSGQEGNVTAEELARHEAQGGGFGPHYSDQLNMYASLVEDDNVTASELGKYFHSMQFAPQGTIERIYEPRDGVTVFRDSFGIPHIYADSMINASYALGWVTAEDRMWQMDVFRHAARGTLTELVGSGADDGYLKMDIETRREGYTQEEVQKMFDDLDDKYGAMGRTIQAGLQAYADGVNAASDPMTFDPRVRPVEYDATGNNGPTSPELWDPTDTLYLAILQLRVFGETAGQELDNAGMLYHLRERLGNRLGTKVYNDFAFQNDPSSYSSVRPEDGFFPSQRLGDVNWKSVAIPDHADTLAQGVALRAANRDRILSALGFRAPASNALLVSANKSATGNPLQIGAPQVGYGAPAFFMDVAVHAPGVDFRGPAVPGASALIPLGRGRDYAWSLTTGMSDAVDVRVERLCETGEEPASIDSNNYRFKGECKAMESRDETFIIDPNPADQTPPGEETHTFYRTVHGPVFARGTVKGNPVAFVKERFFWKKEIDSIPQFYRWNTKVHSIEDFAAAAEDFTMSFNAFYADSEDIGYFHVGQYPRRPKGVHPSLPTWGTGQWEWQGRIPFARHPKVVNPGQGWVANWNNKPALSWNNYDNLKFGRIQRVQLLSDRMHQLLDNGSAALEDIVNVIRDAATRDARAVYLGPTMVKFMKATDLGEAKYGSALSKVHQWIKAGAHRKNANRDATMDNSAALMLFDTWYTNLVHEVFDDEIGKDDFGTVPAPISDYTPAGGSSFFFDFSSYLANLLDPKTRGTFARNYCDKLDSATAETCKQAVVAAFRAAVDKLVTDHGADMGKWSKAAENLAFQAFGAGSVTPIPWQNRGTHNHAVEILSDAG
jgi:acyl-homoserine lactone acylase PvdQ